MTTRARTCDGGRAIHLIIVLISRRIRPNLLQRCFSPASSALKERHASFCPIPPRCHAIQGPVQDLNMRARAHEWARSFANAFALKRDKLQMDVGVLDREGQSTDCRCYVLHGMLVDEAMEVNGDTLAGLTTTEVDRAEVCQLGEGGEDLVLRDGDACELPSHSLAGEGDVWQMCPARLDFPGVAAEVGTCRCSNAMLADCLAGGDRQAVDLIPDLAWQVEEADGGFARAGGV